MKRLFSIVALSFILLAVPAQALTPEEKLEGAMAQCETDTARMIRVERDAYREVQLGGEEQGVLGAGPGRTTDLVPYLVLNYHALSCRLRALCSSVDIATGRAGEGTLLPHQPLGCSRLFAARGRWWSPERRDQSLNLLEVSSCDYDKISKDPAFKDVPTVWLTPTFFTVGDNCRVMVDQVLQEERQMLRLLVAEESSIRGVRQVLSLFQTVLREVREGFLEPLRGLVDLFGSVLHPIPCLMTQCN
jgi:hypothetical protein